MPSNNAKFPLTMQFKLKSAQFYFGEREIERGSGKNKAYIFRPVAIKPRNSSERNSIVTRELSQWRQRVQEREASALELVALCPLLCARDIQQKGVIELASRCDLTQGLSTLYPLNALFRHSPSLYYILESRQYFK